MYNTNSYPDSHCLIYDVLNHCIDPGSSESSEAHQTILFCLRPSEEDNFVRNFSLKDPNDPSLAFGDLKKQNITSSHLLSWSASIDLAEQYQIFLDNYSNLSSENEISFYNCTSSWFGPFCRFAFDFEMNLQFLDLILNPFVLGEKPMVTCYKHLFCQTKLSCLDWREICDGKSDCLDGSDENNCWQLEVNECAENEYRCHNGQCIPFEFVRDDTANPDCLDRTDEGKESYSRVECGFGFCCEEHMCRLGEREFPCGDGVCTNGIDRCGNGRTSLLPNDFCSNGTACLMELYGIVDAEWCDKYCSNTNCVKNNCPMLYEVRFLPLLFGHVRFLYSNTELKSGRFYFPDYVCYDEELCSDFLHTTKLFDNLTCCHISDLGLTNTDLYDNLEKFVESVKGRFRKCLVDINLPYNCNYSTMYRCENSSKCISKQRLLDGVSDCPFDDDETFNQSCSLGDIHQRFRCLNDGNEKCFASLIVQDGKKDCQHGEDERNKNQQIIEEHIYFQTICDGKTELLPVLIDKQNETDETQCNHWPCNNTYSRCDQFWLCKDGADEVNCPSSTCPKLHQECVFPNDISKVSCLPIDRVRNGIDDCLGGTDERRKYRVSSENTIRYGFHCWNDTKYIDVKDLCNRIQNCPFNDDEIFCKKFGFEEYPHCSATVIFTSDVENFLCRFGSNVYRKQKIFFKLLNILTYPSQITIDNTSIPSSIQMETFAIKDRTIINTSVSPKHLCNRGIPIRLRMSHNTSVLSCLCPPNYYGNNCEYQNQRVSLTVQIRVTSDWRSLFIFLITLIDDEKNIQSHDHIEYLPVRDCHSKYNIYLLYSTRPKNSSKNYSVQIDAFDQLKLNYRASWIFSLRFPFLPVHRLSVLLKVPFSNVEPIYNCWPPCVHGQCFLYINEQKWKFCQCEPGWSGVHCNVKYRCDCASDSLCISNSICLCPPNRFGPRCHLSQLSCNLKSCMNGGQCVSKDVRFSTLTFRESSMCVCPQGYQGQSCEYQERLTQINISFHHEVSIPSSLLIHLIAVHNNVEHNRTTIIRKIVFNQYSLVLYTSTSFNIAIAQIFSQYYLIIIREQIIVSLNISTEIIPQDRCRSIDELFNETFGKQHLLKRIKYYHILCQQQSSLICFYDEIQFCLCTLDRQANCFEFDHHIKYDCEGKNFCQNQGYCLLDDPKCPTSSICACRQCSFGSRCQFSTEGSSLSLDTILGHHIHSNIKISQQATIVKVAISFTAAMLLFGFINSFLCFETFRGERARNVGCGIYLLTSSFISMITMIVFSLKLSFFLSLHMGLISNRSVLYLQCASIDFLLRVFLSSVDWFSGCVAIERVTNVLKGIQFDKTKSKQVAKWMVLIIIIFTSCTYIYDPLHRRLMVDEEEQRLWCVSQYSSSLQIFDQLLNIFHFSVPFIINCISPLIIVISIARTRSKCQKTKTLKRHLYKQLQQHKYLLISPSIIVILSVPRLIISFFLGCMKSARDSWLYLIGYSISFIPSIMTFVIFVLPSRTYRSEFNQTVKHICQK